MFLYRSIVAAALCTPRSTALLLEDSTICASDGKTFSCHSSKRRFPFQKPKAVLNVFVVSLSWRTANHSSDSYGVSDDERWEADAKDEVKLIVRMASQGMDDKVHVGFFFLFWNYFYMLYPRRRWRYQCFLENATESNSAGIACSWVGLSFHSFQIFIEEVPNKSHDIIAEDLVIDSYSLKDIFWHSQSHKKRNMMEPERKSV